MGRCEEIHRPPQHNVAYIFNHGSCVSSLPKITAQHLEQWKMAPAQFEYSTMLISGERNCRGDSLSRWVNVPAVKVRAVAMFAPTEPDDNIPSKEVVRRVRQSARGKARTRAHVAAIFMAPHGKAVEDGDGVFRIEVKGRGIMWITGDAEELQQRLVVSAHIQGTGHRGTATTLQRAQEYC